MLVADGLGKTDAALLDAVDEHGDGFLGDKTEVVGVFDKDAHGTHDENSQSACHKLGAEGDVHHVDVIDKWHPYIVEQKTKDERTATADEIDEGGIAHNAGIGVEHLHRNCHQGHATYIGEDVIPEMVDKHITSHHKIDGKHTGYHDVNTVNDQDTPIWHCAMREVPVG